MLTQDKLESLFDSTSLRKHCNVKKENNLLALIIKMYIQLSPYTQNKAAKTFEKKKKL